jgi:hypothetical protein
MSATPPNHFDRGKPFYPLVMAYLIQLVGFRDLAALGIPHAQREFKIVCGGSALQEAEDAEAEVLLNKLLEPLGLQCAIDGTSIRVDGKEIAKELVKEHLYLIEFVLRSAGSLLILAHEMNKDAPWHDYSPLWEFLRHCRNAAAHGGTFTLRNGEPRRPATWRRFSIEQSLNGTPLFKGADGVGLLRPGDPIKLLWDIEQAFPGMHA